SRQGRPGLGDGADHGSRHRADPPPAARDRGASGHRHRAESSVAHRHVHGSRRQGGSNPLGHPARRWAARHARSDPPRSRPAGRRMTSTELDGFAEYEDFEGHARETLARGIYDHLAAGALSNWTRDENRRAFDRWVFDKRLMRPVANTDLS